MRVRMKVGLLALVVAGGLGLTALVAYAEDKTVAQVVQTGQRDEVVTVAGTVGAKADDNAFQFEDGTGTIKLDLGPPWWAQHDLSPGMRITVQAEVGKGRDGSQPAELDAIKITKPDGSVIEVRPAVGPPPWAGGPAKVGAKHPGYQGFTNRGP